jgi:hypothetical protein
LGGARAARWWAALAAAIQGSDLAASGALLQIDETRAGERGAASMLIDSIVRRPSPCSRDPGGDRRCRARGRRYFFASSLIFPAHEQLDIALEGVFRVGQIDPSRPPP